jgi:hypothetical protein
MNIRIWCHVAAGTLILGSAAARAEEKKLPAPLEEAPAPEIFAPADTSGCDAKCEAVRALWVDKMCPQVGLFTREERTPLKRQTVEVEYVPEKRTFKEIVFKPRLVERMVPVCTLRPETVTDCHGHCTTVMKPCTEMKTVQEVVFDAVTVDRQDTVQVPRLVKKEAVVTQKTIILEYRTEFVKQGYPILIPDEVRKEQFLHAPKPECPELLMEPAK